MKLCFISFEHRNIQSCRHLWLRSFLNYIMWLLDQKVKQHEKARDTKHVQAVSGLHNTW